jgi:hypothetical protein
MLSQTEQLKSFLSEISKQPTQQSILAILQARIFQLEHKAMFGAQKRGAVWLLGWYEDAATGRLTCLPQIGGCTIVDAKFLIERMWSARANFLRAAKWAAITFPGWSGLLFVVWDTLVKNYGGVKPMNTARIT